MVSAESKKKKKKKKRSTESAFCGKFAHQEISWKILYSTQCTLLSSIEKFRY